MRNLDAIVSGILQPLIQGIRNRYTPVLPAGTSDADHQLMLPLGNISRDQEGEKIAALINEHSAFRKSHDIVSHRPVIARQMFERIDIKRIG